MQSDNSGDTGAGGERQGLSSLVDRTDLILAVVIVAACAALYYATTRFEKVPDILSQNIPPTWFPRLLLAIITILTIIIPFEHLFYAEGKKHLDEDRSVRIRPISFYTALLLCVIVALMPWLGTFVIMILVSALLPLLWGERRWKVIIPFAIVFPGLVTLLFTQVLGVYFEPGIWAHLF